MPRLDGMSPQIQTFNAGQLTQLRNTKAKDAVVDATSTNKAQVVADLQTAINTNSTVQIVTNVSGNKATTVNLSKEQAIALLDQYKKGSLPLSQVEIQTGDSGHHGPPTVLGTVGHDVGVNVAHHTGERVIEHVAERGLEHAAVRAAEHGAGEALAHGAMTMGGRLASVAAPGVGAVAAGYLAVQGVKHSMHAAERGNTGAAIAFALAATVDGTTAAVNGAGAVSGAGVLISTPVSIGLGVVATGLSALGAWLDDEPKPGKGGHH